MARTSGSRGVITRRQSLLRDMSDAVSRSDAIMTSMSLSVKVRMRFKSARGFDFKISFRERLTIGIALSPLCGAGRDDSPAVGAPCVYDHEHVLTYFTGRDHPRLA